MIPALTGFVRSYVAQPENESGDQGKSDKTKLDCMAKNEVGWERYSGTVDIFLRLDARSEFVIAVLVGMMDSKIVNDVRPDSGGVDQRSRRSPRCLLGDNRTAEQFAASQSIGRRDLLRAYSRERAPHFVLATALSQATSKR